MNIVNVGDFLGRVKEKGSKGQLQSIEIKMLFHRRKKRVDKLPKGISEILPSFLYQGSARDAEDGQELKKKKYYPYFEC